MTERATKVTLIDVPDPGKLEEHGISINAPTPTQFVMPDPWRPSSGNGPNPAGAATAASGSPDPAPPQSNDE